MAYRTGCVSAGVFFVAGLLLAPFVAGAADWPQWRGPNRDGVTPEKSGYPDGWPPKRLWSRNVGVGCSSPIIVAGRLYVMGWAGKGNLRNNPVGTDTVFCFDARTGKLRWKQTYPCRYQGRLRIGDIGQYGGPASTPAFDAKTKRLYTLSIDGDLRCWDADKDGRLLWAKNFYDAYKVRQRPKVGRGVRDFGYTSSPLIRGNLLIVEVGADEGTVMAFEKTTGRRVWASALKGPAGHTSGPVRLTVQGVECIASLTLTRLVVMRADKPDEGKTIAEYPRMTDNGLNIATPAVADNIVVLTSDYNQSNTTLTEVSLGQARRKWLSRSHGRVSSPVIYKGHIYLADGAFKCLDLATGRRKWRGGNFGHGTCLVTGDNKVIAFGRGKLALLEALPKDNTYRQLSLVTKVVPRTCYPHVVLAGRIICCKDLAGNMVCFSVSGPSDRPAPGPKPRAHR